MREEELLVVYLKMESEGRMRRVGEREREDGRMRKVGEWERRDGGGWTECWS